VAADVVTEYEARVCSLFEGVPELALDDEERPQPLTLRLEPSAEAAFDRYEQELAVARRALGRSDRAEDEAADLRWLAKLAGQTARLAACLHVASEWATGVATSTTITRETVVSAIKLAYYFHAHALAVFGLMGELPKQRRAALILDWLRQRDSEEPL